MIHVKTQPFNATHFALLTALFNKSQINEINNNKKSKAIPVTGRGGL
jgi:hypothetical protein